MRVRILSNSCRISASARSELLFFSAPCDSPCSELPTAAPATCAEDGCAIRRNIAKRARRLILIAHRVIGLPSVSTCYSPFPQRVVGLASHYWSVVNNLDSPAGCACFFGACLQPNVHDSETL